jgi:hypothetical protein
VTFKGVVTAIPEYQLAKFPHICNVSDATPMVIQNQTSWNETGCLKGFTCRSSTSLFVDLR